jgi:hypothetical protein
MATLKKEQKRLDKAKWLESQSQGFDMSGCMLYCQECEYADHTHPTENGKCYAPQEKREKEQLCARSYNRLVNRGRKK